MTVFKKFLTLEVILSILRKKESLIFAYTVERNKRLGEILSQEEFFTPVWVFPYDLAVQLCNKQMLHHYKNKEDLWGVRISDWAYI